MRGICSLLNSKSELYSNSATTFYPHGDMMVAHLRWWLTYGGGSLTVVAHLQWWLI